MADEEQTIVSAIKRRGVMRASITRLLTRFEELEDDTTHKDSAKLEVTQQIKTRLSTLNSEFRSQHLEIIDLIENEGTIHVAKEQAILDEHDDRVTTLASSIQCLLNGLASSVLSPKYVPGCCLVVEVQHPDACRKYRTDYQWLMILCPLHPKTMKSVRSKKRLLTSS